MRQKLKIRKQKPENIKKWAAASSLPSGICAFLFAALMLTSGCATTTGVQEERQIATLTAIDITDNTLNINADKPFKYTIYKPSDPYKAIVELPDVRLGIAAGKIKSEKAGITEIIPSQTDEPLLSKLEILLSSPASIVPAYKGTLLTLNIINLEEGIKAKTTEKASETLKTEEKTQEVKAPAEKAKEPAVMETKAEAAMPEKPVEGKYKGQKISLDFQDAEIEPIFRLLADISGYNFVIDPSVKGKITLKLMNVPWEQALDVILQTFGLGKSIEGNIIRIAPYAVIAKGSEDARKAEKEKQLALEELAPLERKTYRLTYANVENVKNQLLGRKLTSTEDKVTKELKITYEYDEKLRILSPRGTTTSDRTSNVLVVSDIPTKIAQVNDFIKEIDQPALQVMIEAKIVEVGSNYSESLGIRWGGNLGSASPQVGFGNIDINSGTFSVNTPIVTAGAAATNPGGVLGLSLGSANTVKVDLSLSALESVGKSRRLSNPKIMTMDNEAATIQQGVSIPVQTVSAEGTKTEYVNATLSLGVTPSIRITPDGYYVQLKINATNNALGILTPQGYAIETKSINTQALVKNGDTLVVGGIYTTNTVEGEEGIPLLSKIPLLGWLFKTKTQTGPNVTELLVFITPTIVKP